MSNGKLGNGTTVKFVETMMAMLRQAKRVDMIKLMPQRVEDGKMYSAFGTVMATYNGEDIEFETAEKLNGTTRVTEIFLDNYFKKINEYFGPVSEREGVSEEESTASEEAIGNGSEDDATVIEDEKSWPKFEKAIAKGKFDKAKAMLDKEDPDYKYWKKVLKQAVKNG